MIAVINYTRDNPPQPPRRDTHSIRYYRDQAYAHLCERQSLPGAVGYLVTLGCAHNLAVNCVDWVVLNRFEDVVRN